MGSAFAEVTEAQAEGKTKSVYDDVKRSLRVPYIDPVFRELAMYPDYLETAWAALKPNIQTVYFERQSDALRQLAVDSVAAFEGSGVKVGSLAPLLRALQNASPKFYLASAALRSAMNGEQPRMERLSADEKRQAPTGRHAAAAAEVLLDPPADNGESAGLLEEILMKAKLHALTTEYRALMSTPRALDSVWAVLGPVLEMPGYQQLQRSLRQQGEQAVRALPFRMDVNPHVLRHAGLSERGIDSIRAVLGRAYLEGPGVLANVALLAGGLHGAPEQERPLN